MYAVTNACDRFVTLDPDFLNRRAAQVFGVRVVKPEAPQIGEEGFVNNVRDDRSDHDASIPIGERAEEAQNYMVVGDHRNLTASRLQLGALHRVCGSLLLTPGLPGCHDLDYSR